MKRLIGRLSGPLIALVLFGVALWLLQRALNQYRYQDVAAYFRGLQIGRAHV